MPLYLYGIFEMMQSPSESPWTERSDVRISYGSAVYTNMYKALPIFEDWIPSKLSQLGFTFDQATLFTGYAMTDFVNLTVRIREQC